MTANLRFETDVLAAGFAAADTLAQWRR